MKSLFNHFIKLFINACLIIGYCLLVIRPVSAQTSSLAISPPVVEILLSPNKKIIQAFTLTNQGETTEFVASIHRFVPTDSAGHGTIDPAPLDLTLLPIIVGLENADIELDRPFTVDRGQSQQLVVSLEAQNLEGSEDSYLALVVSSIPSLTPNDQNLTPIPGISTLILTTVTDGHLPIDLEVTSFNPPVLHDPASPLTLEIELSNQGQAMIRPEGKLALLKPSGSELASYALYPNLVLKGSKRLIQGINKQNEAIPLTFYPKWYHLGPYRLHLQVKTPGGTTIQDVERTVWLLPIRAIILTVLLAIILTSLLIKLKRGSNKVLEN